MTGARRWTFIALVLAAGALRLAATNNQFWLDEIISWDIARTCSRALDIFTTIHSDNNHHLNTLWLYALGPNCDWRIYRLFSVITGTAAVAMMGLLARKWSNAASVIAMLLGGGSYFLIHYASEARGYAPACFFALASAWLVERYLATRERRYSLAFGVCVVLGFASHLTFAYVWLGLFVWSMFLIWRRANETPGQSASGVPDSAPPLRQSIALHGVPIAFLLLFFVLQVSNLPPAGGPVFSRLSVILETFAWTLGTPRGEAILIAACIASVAACTIELSAMFKARSSEWILYLTIILLAPALMLMLWRQPFLYPRYFLLAVPFFLLVLSALLARLWNRGGAARAICVVAIGLYLLGNGFNFSRFLEHGRGQYCQAMQFIAQQSTGETTVGSPQERRVGLTLDFYRDRCPAQLHPVPRSEFSTTQPAWIIVDTVDGEPSPPTQLTTPEGAHYRPAATFTYFGLSGFHWHVFKLEPAGESPLPSTNPAKTPEKPEAAD